jgi:uncharacterized membrane protein
MIKSHAMRFWEVDLLRGWAIVLMILYHLAYDLNYFGVYAIDMYSGFWFYFARLTVTLFLLLVGISLTLSHFNAINTGRANQFGMRLIKRSVRLFCIAMGITIISYFLIGKGFIVFGVLHFIAIALLFAYPFLRLRWLNVIFGLIFISIGLFLQNLSVNFPWLIWIGLVPKDFYSLDYVPIFPWFGVMLIGVALGDLFYQGYNRKFSLSESNDSILASSLSYIGRKSLIIYLIHQPILIALIYAICYPHLYNQFQVS